MTNNSFLFLRIFFIALTLYLIYHLQMDLNSLKENVEDLSNISPPPPRE